MNKDNWKVVRDEKLEKMLAESLGSIKHSLWSDDGNVGVVLESKDKNECLEALKKLAEYRYVQPSDGVQEGVLCVECKALAPQQMELEEMLWDYVDKPNL